MAAAICTFCGAEYSRRYSPYCSAVCRIAANVAITESGCWEWTAAIDRHGYGRFKWGSGDRTGAHRAAYQLLVGPIPDGLTIDHLCRNTRCVNPDHLEPVTQRVNNLRGNCASTLNVGKTHCPQGHPYDEANTYHTKGRTSRHCRTCNRAAVARLKARKQAAA